MNAVELGLAVAAALAAFTVWRLGWLQAPLHEDQDDYPYTGLPDLLNADVAHVDTRARATQELRTRARRLVDEHLTPPDAAQVRIHISQVTSARGWPHAYLELEGPPALLEDLKAEVEDLNSSAILAGAAPKNR